MKLKHRVYILIVQLVSTRVMKIPGFSLLFQFCVSFTIANSAATLYDLWQCTHSINVGTYSLLAIATVNELGYLYTLFCITHQPQWLFLGRIDCIHVG